MCENFIVSRVVEAPDSLLKTHMEAYGPVTIKTFFIKSVYYKEVLLIITNLNRAVSAAKMDPAGQSGDLSVHYIDAQKAFESMMEFVHNPSQPAISDQYSICRHNTMDLLVNCMDVLVNVQMP